MACSLTTTIVTHLDSLSGVLPGGGIEILRDELTRVSESGIRVLSITYFACFHTWWDRICNTSAERHRHRARAAELCRPGQRDWNAFGTAALARAASYRRPVAVVDLLAWPKPGRATLALDHAWQRERCITVVDRFAAVLLVCREFRQLQQDLWFARRGDRLHGFGCGSP
jgi:hypothetical protein